MATTDDVFNEIEAVVSDLLGADEDQLYEQLGLRVRLIEGDQKTETQVAPAFLRGDELISRDDLRHLGKSVFQEMNTAAWHLVCGSDATDSGERQRILQSFDVGPTAVAAYLALALISAGVAPLFAPVVAALVIALFMKPTYRATCEFWKEHL